MAGPGYKPRQTKTPSKDTSFPSNYAGNAGSQVHLKCPRNTDQAKDLGPHADPLPSPAGTCSLAFFSTRAGMYRALQSCCVIGEYINEMVLYLAFVICYFSLTYCLRNDSIIERAGIDCFQTAAYYSVVWISLLPYQ